MTVAEPRTAAWHGDRRVGQAPIRRLARGHLWRPSPLPRGGGRVLPAGLPRTGPGDADVVIANAYPIDVSLTFMRSKGPIPLLLARADALARVDREQDGRRDLEVVVYPCAPLQVLEPAGQPCSCS